MSDPSPPPFDGPYRGPPDDGVNTAMVLACIVGGLALAMILIGWV